MEGKRRRWDAGMVEQRPALFLGALKEGTPVAHPLIIAVIVARAVLERRDQFSARREKVIQGAEEPDEHPVAEIIEQPDAVDHVLRAELLPVPVAAHHFLHVLLPEGRVPGQKSRCGEQFLRKLERIGIEIDAGDRGAGRLDLAGKFLDLPP